MGMRKPSLKQSLKARTTGRAKRAIKKSIVPVPGVTALGIFVVHFYDELIFPP